jgi:hypothetical protein
MKVGYATDDDVASLVSHSVAKNISRGGVRLLISRLVKKGDTLKLKIFKDDPKKPVKAEGTVRWVAKNISPYDLIVDAGIQFTDIKPSEVDQLLATVQ